LKHGADIHANKDTALRWATENGRYKVVKLLLNNGANIHANNDDALRWAKYNGDEKMIKLLESYINK
ncbi:MAG TPA: ankyrin repeat domain-containing protein, partial [Bacteroidales bacterium]|nr:ankyrin repeat domain-containing protein [Bacteroidales bacterium]